MMVCSNFSKTACLPASLAAAVVIAASASAGCTIASNRPDAAATVASQWLKSLIHIDFALGR